MTELTLEIKKDNQVKSKKRVAEHGEVFTNDREVNAILDLMKHQTEIIDSKINNIGANENSEVDE